MEAKIQKWGNSLAVRIPKYLADLASIADGSVVDIKFVNSIIQIEPISPTEYRLDDLLDNINSENIHQEMDFGKAKGKEML